MARIRTIKPEFFSHQRLSGCTPHARLLAIAVLQLADCEGRFRWIPMQVHGHAFPFEPNINIDELASELESIEYIKRYIVDSIRYCQIPMFLQHQRLSGKEAESLSKFPPCHTEKNKNTQGNQSVSPGEQTENTRGRIQRFTGKQTESQEREREREREKGTGNMEGSRKGATDCPTDFLIDEKFKVWAKETLGIISNLDQETQKFIDHWRSVGKKRKDWTATYRNWLRNATSPDHWAYNPALTRVVYDASKVLG